MKNNQLATLLLMTASMFLSSIQSAQAAEHEDHSGHDHTRPDSHAPIGVSGDHLMREGEVMLTYRFMSMEMDGNRMDTSRVDTPLTDYMVSPLSMDMDMHMIGAMYAPTDKLTLMVMVPYTSISMDHRVNMNNKEFTTESSGSGDEFANGSLVSDSNRCLPEVESLVIDQTILKHSYILDQSARSIDQINRFFRQ